MSTRSGKRIHKSLHENTLPKENDSECNGERKTRSRRLKQNLDNLNISLPKLRRNYVQYPSTDEDPVIEGQGQVTGRSLRNQTLRELNNDEGLLTNDNESIIKPKATRLTRITKRTAEENGVIENLQQHEEVKTKKAKKGKKEKVNELNGELHSEKENVDQGQDPNNEKPTQTNKKKRKGKKSIEKSVIKTNSMNNTISSLDSFHSASDSPLKPDTANNEKDNISIKADSNEVENQSDVDPTPPKKSQKKSKKAKKEVKNKSKAKTVEIAKDIADAKIIDNVENENTKLNGTFDVETENLQSVTENIKTKSVTEETLSTKPLDSTFDKNVKTNSITEDTLSIKPLNSTFDKEADIINTTFDKGANSSDNTANLTFDKSNNSIPKINISSDNSISTENILNTTPVLIESSMDCTKTPENEQERVTRSKVSVTPLKREGTFTKDGPEPIFMMSPAPKVLNNLTPSKRKMSLPSPGRTPYHSGSKNDKKGKNMIDHTHSVVKPKRRSSLEPTRSTKVMFCSPVNNTMMMSQTKSRVIKSSMKGSSKSFVFDDNGSKSTRLSRKRSFTTNDFDESCRKRSKLADDLQVSVDRLSRPRTSSASNKLSSTTPSKKPLTPGKSKSDGQASRSKLPNFAALHQKQFAKMESLDECQERKAKRAQRLLVPVGGLNVLERSSPRVPQDPKSVTKEDTNKKSQTVAKSHIDTKHYTRFGFKLNLDVNPFSITSTTKKHQEREANDKKSVQKSEKQPMPKHTNFLKRSFTQYSIKKVTKTPLPSFSGATALRKDEAKQVILKEKPKTALKERSASKRLENRTTIKGVRTNRRFELQMLSRNVD